VGQDLLRGRATTLGMRRPAAFGSARRSARPTENCWDRAAQSARSLVPTVECADRITTSGTDDGAVQDCGNAPSPDRLAAVDEFVPLTPDQVGWFRFYFDEQRWEWSEQVQRLHGYQPGAVTPTTDLVLAHKHPDDRDEVAANLHDITHTRGAFSSRHRIVKAGGAVRWVAVIGDQFFDDDGTVIGTHGFYVDVTSSTHLREDLITAKVIEIADKRADIEQVKGMLMLLYNIDEQVAFGLLKWLSQESNIKLRVLAQQIGIDLRAAAHDEIVTKAAFDHMLLTAHQRVKSDGGSSV
jgi:hypothetical protein